MFLFSDQSRKTNEVESTFWREWKLKLEEQKRVADHSRTLENIIPGVQTSRFLSGDRYYIESVVLSLIESVNLEKKHILMDILNLANTYGMNRTEVFRFASFDILKCKYRSLVLTMKNKFSCRCY